MRTQEAGGNREEISLLHPFPRSEERTFRLLGGEEADFLFFERALEPGSGLISLVITTYDIFHAQFLYFNYFLWSLSSVLFHFCFI